MKYVNAIDKQNVKHIHEFWSRAWKFVRCGLFFLRFELQSDSVLLCAMSLVHPFGMNQVINILQQLCY